MPKVHSRELKREIKRELKRELKRKLKRSNCKQAGRQASRKALGRHSVGAMPWRGLLGLNRCSHKMA